MPEKLKKPEVSRDEYTKVGFVAPKHDLLAERLNQLEYKEWAANEVQTKFFDQDSLGLGSQVHKAVTGQLKGVNESIARLKDDLAKATTTEQRTKISEDLEKALNQKLKLMDEALNNRISTVIDVVGDQPDNPVFDTFQSLTTLTARSHVIQDNRERDEKLKNLQQV